MSLGKEIEKIIFNTGMSFEQALIKYKVSGGGEPQPPIVIPKTWGELDALNETWLVKDNLNKNWEEMGG